MAEKLSISELEKNEIIASLNGLHDMAEVNRVNNEKLLKCVGQLKNSLTLALSDQNEDALEELKWFDCVPITVSKRKGGKETKKQAAANARQSKVDELLAKERSDGEVVVEPNPEPDDNNIVGGGEGGVRYLYGIRNGSDEMNKGVFVNYRCDRYNFSKKQLKDALDETIAQAGLESEADLADKFFDVEDAIRNYTSNLVMSELENLPQPVYLECDIPAPFAGQNAETVLAGLPEPLRSAFIMAVEVLPLAKRSPDDIAVLIARAADDMRTDVNELRCNYPLLKLNKN